MKKILIALCAITTLSITGCNSGSTTNSEPTAENISCGKSPLKTLSKSIMDTNGNIYVAGWMSELITPNSYSAVYVCRSNSNTWERLGQPFQKMSWVGALTISPGQDEITIGHGNGYISSIFAYATPNESWKSESTPFNGGITSIIDDGTGYYLGNMPTFDGDNASESLNIYYIDKQFINDLSSFTLVGNSLISQDELTDEELYNISIESMFIDTPSQAIYAVDNAGDFFKLDTSENGDGNWDDIDLGNNIGYTISKYGNNLYVSGTIIQNRNNYISLMYSNDTGNSWNQLISGTVNQNNNLGALTGIQISQDGQQIYLSSDTGMIFNYYGKTTLNKYSILNNGQPLVPWGDYNYSVDSEIRGLNMFDGYLYAGIVNSQVMKLKINN